MYIWHLPTLHLLPITLDGVLTKVHSTSLVGLQLLPPPLIYSAILWRVHGLGTCYMDFTVTTLSPELWAYLFPPQFWASTGLLPARESFLITPLPTPE